MARLSGLLQKRSPVLWIFSPDRTVAEAVQTMAERQVGAVPIVSGGRLVGIFSERDLLRRVIAPRRVPEETPLSLVMTPDPVTAAPDEDRLLAIEKMQEVGCRHLPILVNGELLDMISMRDLLFVELEERAAEVRQLREYIRGTY